MREVAGRVDGGGERQEAAAAANHAALAFLAYAAVFAAGAWPWLRIAADSVPRTPFGNRSDECLVAHVLAWGAHALASRPLELFALPINYPAPHQLTGSEHFLSTLLVFAPAFWLTGNAVLAANLAVFLSYPLTALAMYWLAVRLGCGRLVAFAAGLALALGGVRVPAHLHLVQYLVLYLPLVAGSLTALRARPTMRRTLGLAAVCLLAFFSSYYMFVFTLMVAALWGLAEAWRPGGGRAAFVLRAGVGVAVPLAALAVFSSPYLMRPEAALFAHAKTPPSAPAVFLAGVFSASTGPLLRFLAVCGLAGLWSADPAARTLARRGLACAVVGGVLMLGPVLAIGETTVPLPYALVSASPLAFVRYPYRFITVVGFGRALLAASALQIAWRHLPGRLGAAAVLAVGAAIVATRVPQIGTGPYDTMPAVHEPIYTLVAGAAAGGGSLLELPVEDRADAHRYSEGESIVGQTRHWVPLVLGHTGYHPPHRWLVLQVIRRLPAPEAIQTLVDVTHVRWILLRPAAEWPASRRRWRGEILHAPWAAFVAKRGDWILLRVDLPPQGDDFFAAVARGWRPGESVLGARDADLPASAARATVAGKLPAVVAKGRLLPVPVTVTNEGDATWPVSVPRFGPSFPSLWPSLEGRVTLRVTWRHASPAEAGPPVVFTIKLPRDVRAHETLREVIALPTPPDPGTYDVDVTVAQADGTGFAPPGSRSLGGRVEVR